MRDVAKVLSLTAALLVVGCGSDDSNFNYGWYNPGGGGNPGVVAPVAVADSFSVLSGGTLTGSVTANDTLNGATVTAFQNPSTSGGAVAITAAGQLTYTPPTGQTNISDTFTYTLSNSAGSATATVTVAVGARGFFVKNDVASTGSGSQASPFKTLLEATTAAAGINGAQIVVFRGDGTATGQNVPVALSANQGIVAQDPANQPTISGPINLASNTTLSNLRLVGTTGGDAVIGTGIAGATLSNLTIANTTVNGVNMTNPTGTLTMTGLSFSNIGRAAFPLNINTGTLTVVAGDWTASNTTGNVSEAIIAGSAVVNSTFTRVSFQNIGAGLGTGFEWDAQGASNCTFTASDYSLTNALNGLFFTSEGAASAAILVSNANITNCATSNAIALNCFDSSSLKTRVTNSRLVGNFQGFRASASSNLSATLSARLTGNTSDSYQFAQALNAVLRVESLSTLSNPDNVGSTATGGTVLDVPVGSTGIPE